MVPYLNKFFRVWMITLLSLGQMGLFQPAIATQELQAQKAILDQPAPAAKPKQEPELPFPQSVPSPGSMSSDMAIPPAPPFKKNLGAYPNRTNGENYPIVEEMEAITFGVTKPDLPLDQRLASLEQVVFRQEYRNDSLFDRTQRLKLTIFGTADESTGFESASDLINPWFKPTLNLYPDKNSQEFSFLDEIAQRPENLKEADSSELEKFALELANYARGEMGYSGLRLDPVASKMAQEQGRELAERNLISHANRSGDNPDRRYTLSGGSDALTESVISVKGDGGTSHLLSRALVAKAFKKVLQRQDDRDAILLPDATGFGFSIHWMSSGSSALACLEITTKHGVMKPVELPLTVGDKAEVKGLVLEPYRFDRITVGWEGAIDHPPPPSDETEEALPYFPPLDYVAFSSKAEHDYQKAVGTLRMLGVIAAIAGGVFVPPVALAAPMIAASGSLSEPKPLSDIPVHGGVKVEGASFLAKIPLSNAGKAGLYYVTVWAVTGRNEKPVPISRRVFKVDDKDGSTLADAQEGSKKKHHHKKLTVETQTIPNQ